MKKKRSNIKDILCNIVYITGLIIVLVLFSFCTMHVKCLGERSGAMVVIGGNSMRCL